MAVEFSRLAVARTVPMVWGSDALELAQAMRHMFGAILDPELPGRAAYNPRADNSEWLVDGTATEHLAADTELWLRSAQEVRSSAEHAFHTMVDEGQDSAICFDLVRLRALAEQLELDFEPYDAENLVFSFRSDWSLVGRDSPSMSPRLLWTPLLLISASPFDSGNHCATEVDAATVRRTWAPAEAGDVLENVLWLWAQPLFTLVKHALGVPDARFAIRDDPIRPPAFYYVEAAEATVLDTMTDDAEWAESLREVTGPTIRTRRLTAGFIARGSIEDRFLGFRRIFDQRSFYVFVDGREASGLESSYDAFGRVVDQMSYVETTASALATQLLQQLDMNLPLLGTWRGSIDRAADLDSRLFHRLSLARLGRANRSRSVRLVERLHIGFRRFERITSPKINEIRSAGSEFNEVVAETHRMVRNRLGFRSFGDGSAGLDHFDDLGPITAAHEAVAALVDFTDDLINLVAKTTQYWGETVVSERELREEVVGRHERLVGIGLAMIAALGALPFLIGSSDWRELSTQLGDWPSWISPLADVLIDTHRELTVAAVLLSLALAVFLAGVLVYRLQQRLRRRGGLVGDLGARILAVRDFSNDTMSARLAGDERAANEFDRKCFEALLIVAEALRELQNRAQKSESLELAIQLLLLRLEVFDFRLAPLAGPRAAAFYYAAGHLELGPAVMTPEEIRLVLSVSGLEESLVDGFVGALEGCDSLDTLERLVSELSVVLDAHTVLVSAERPDHVEPFVA